ncbi:MULTISPECIES: HI0074 family nucleotidyltransferase substrate-binding subunit [Gordonibacter]|uniref:HI0074 family nucleotidyltransferase substrate-binding subunit n=1 Tax=Gordonibacter faecis TaxID=3047475 RepID=A0ABT7DQG4_9ACTN|nr:MULTISPECIES: HI0074 family nucleotidyltransferase substrate-binding subunit [unclassified Gordonibacter]MDJ1651792.1 HI0074 family nucleotidyltransferase substrate-binding subunit [Gordonibacter sp. KGMB12511]HIW75675.1 nucleotidyltransferase substrate binding protein [Candidatus Gordonibacter avicola]
MSGTHDIDLPYTDRLVNLNGLLWELGQAYGKPVFEDTYVLSGLLSKFRLAFDLSWKLMKDILIQRYGIVDWAKGSPREAIELAAYNGIIEDGARWNEMRLMRNELSHNYNAEFAIDCSRKVLDEWIPFLQAFGEDINVKIKAWEAKDSTV